MPPGPIACHLDGPIYLPDYLGSHPKGKFTAPGSTTIAQSLGLWPLTLTLTMTVENLKVGNKGKRLLEPGRLGETLSLVTTSVQTFLHTFSSVIAAHMGIARVITTQSTLVAPSARNTRHRQQARRLQYHFPRSLRGMYVCVHSKVRKKMVRSATIKSPHQQGPKCLLDVTTVLRLVASASRVSVSTSSGRSSRRAAHFPVLSACLA